MATTGGIGECMSNIFDKFDQIRGKSKSEFPFSFWDIVVLTTADEDQKIGYEMQIKSKLTSKEIPSGITYHVFADPPGPKAGCGGSTIHVVSRLTNIYGRTLENYRILLINAGGQSQRLPSASVLGKIFTLLPLRNPPYSVLELKLASYIPFLERMQPGYFHAASDTIEVFNLGRGENWTFENEGFTALAHPSSLEIGRTHGVYVLEGGSSSANAESQLAETRNCLEVLQKPSIDRMHSKGAVMQNSLGEDFVFTDSVFFFDHSVAKKLHQYNKTEGPLKCEIDGYGDFLQALGPKASIAYTRDIKNVSSVEPCLVETREKIFHLLKGTKLNVVALNASAFYHLGTITEYIQNFCDNTILAQQVGFQFQVFNAKIPHVENELGDANDCKAEISKTACLMHNKLPITCQIKDGSVVEYCNFSSTVNIGRRCVVSSCCHTNSTHDTAPVFSIPNDMFLHTVAIYANNNVQTDPKRLKYVTIFFHQSDNVKKKVTGEFIEHLTFLDMSLEQVSKLFHVSYDQIFNNWGAAQKYSLWEAKLFPAVDTMTESFETAMAMINHDKNGLFNLSEKTCVSMADILQQKNVNEMLRYRNNLYKEIKQTF